MNYLCLIFSEGESLVAPGEARTDGGDPGIDPSWGHRVGSASTGVTVRVRSGELLLSEATGAVGIGPEQEYLLLEANDLNDAIRLASRLHGASVGRVELRPILRDREPRG